MTSAHLLDAPSSTFFSPVLLPLSQPQNMSGICSVGLNRFNDGSLLHLGLASSAITLFKHSFFFDPRISVEIGDLSSFQRTGRNLPYNQANSTVLIGCIIGRKNLTSGAIQSIWLGTHKIGRKFIAFSNRFRILASHRHDVSQFL